VEISAEPGKTYLIEASTNLLNWELIGVATIQDDGSFAVEDQQAARFPQRFYRVVEPQ